MKISELRALLDGIFSEDMKEILVEVYRALPKKTRDDLAIDELLKNPGAARASAKQAIDAVFALKAERLELGKFIDYGLQVVRDSRLNRYTIGSNLAQVLVDRLRTPESLELAIERAALLHSKPDPAPGPKREYCRSDGLNRLAEFGFLAYVRLSDYEKAVDFFKTHYVDRNTEVSLFVLLQWLRSLEREDLWQREYERSVKVGIKPRHSLSGAYRHLKSHGELPRYYEIPNGAAASLEGQ